VPRNFLQRNVQVRTKTKQSSAAIARFAGLRRRVECGRLGGRRKSRHSLTEVSLACIAHSALVRPEVGHGLIAASGYRQSEKYPRYKHQRFSNHQTIHTSHQSLLSNGVIMPVSSRQQARVVQPWRSCART
jgi:hypothetical protein